MAVRLITGGLVVFGAAVTLVMTWSREPLDRVSIRLQPPPFNFEGVAFTCSLLCGFGLAVLAGLLLRNTIAAMVIGYFAWEVPFAVITLLNGPLNFLSATTRIPGLRVNDRWYRELPSRGAAAGEP